MTKEIAELCEKMMAEALDLCGHNSSVYIGPKSTRWGVMIRMEYGDKEYEFNPDGYNYLAVTRMLMNNPVMDAILE